MAKKRHTAEQIISKLRQAEVALAEGKNTADVCRVSHPNNPAASF